MNAGVSHSTNLEKYESGSRILQALIRRFHARICDVLQPLEFRRVLDVGCGEGFLSRALLDRFPGIEVVGVDASASAVEHARLRCPEGRFEQALVEDLGKWTESFDLVICSEVLEHIDDPAAGARLLAARSNGHALVTVPWEPWFQLANFARGKYLRTWGNHPEHIHRWSLGGFVRMLEPAMVVKQSETLFPWSLVLAQPRKD
jgi:2-polyprenyl-3-methyl-5-hydroxy-6-metoxy-1,4-benzoquinol methylase